MQLCALAKLKTIGEGCTFQLLSLIVALKVSFCRNSIYFLFLCRSDAFRFAFSMKWYSKAFKNLHKTTIISFSDIQHCPKLCIRSTTQNWRKLREVSHSLLSSIDKTMATGVGNRTLIYNLEFHSENTKFWEWNPEYFIKKRPQA